MENNYYKKCFRCNTIKSLTEFYPHKQMRDGTLNKCKSCTKGDTKKRSQELSMNPSWHEKEKERHREKYHALGYKDKHKPTPEKRREIMFRYKAKYPEKQAAKTKSSRLICPNGFHLHHWSYNEPHYQDVITLSMEDHFFLHRYLKYDQPFKMYRALDGELLDTREKHETYFHSIRVKETILA